MLIKVFFKNAARLWMAQLADSAFLNLTYSFSCHFQPLPHLLQCMVMIVYQAKTEFYHLSLTRRKLPKHFPNLFSEQLLVGDFHWPTLTRIFDDIAKRILFFLGKRSIQGENFLSPDQQFTDTLRRHAQPLSDNFRRGFSPQFLVELTCHALHAHHFFHYIYRETYYSRTL